MGDNTPPPLPGDEPSVQPDVDLPPISEATDGKNTEIPDLPPLPGGPLGAPPGDPPSDSPASPSNPIPFLILMGVVILGAGVWYYLQNLTEDQNTTGRLSEKKMKAYSGDIPEDGAVFFGIWKGFDADEDYPTNWEIIRNKDKSFTALIKKFHEDDLSVLSLSGNWEIKSKQIHYKVKADHAEGPDLGWPDSWKETIGDIQENRLKLQALQTESRRGPFFEVRSPALGYRQMKNIEVDPDFQPPTLPVTEKAAEEVPEDLVIHYDFNDGARNLAKLDHNPELINAQLTEEDLPPTFGKAVQFGQEESRIQIGNTDGMPLVVDDFTVSLWLRVKGNRADGYGILGSISDGKNLSLTGIGLRTLVQGNPEFLFYHRDAKYRYQGKTKLNDGKWHHLAVTKTGYLAQIYVNGQPEGKLGTIFTRTGSGTTSLSIGKFLDTGMANGAVDNFRLYKRKLSAEEILAIYEYERYIPVGL